MERQSEARKKRSFELNSSFLGALFALVAFVLTLTIAIMGEELNLLSSVLLTSLSGVFQLFSASKFHDKGRAHPSLARASVRRTLRLGRHVRCAREKAETIYDKLSFGQAKEFVGQLSAQLSYMEEEVQELVLDWGEFHRDAISSLEGSS